MSVNEFLTCRICNRLLLADGEGGWSCPRRDEHPDTAKGLRELPKSPDAVAQTVAGTFHQFSAGYGNREYCAVCGGHLSAHSAVMLCPGFKLTDYGVRPFCKYCGHVKDAHPTRTVDAVDPHAASTGKPTPRVSKS